MIQLNDIKSKKAIILLSNYSGINPYILQLKNKLATNGKLLLTENQTNYIIENDKTQPIFINKILSITPFLGESLKKEFELSFTPEKLLAEYILADNNKTIHIYGKLTKNQKTSTMFFIPKNQLITDPYFDEIDVDVDFEKYDNILAKYGKNLFEHQKSGIKFLLGRKGAILADEMGLAKTAQSIISALESGCKKILVICPASVKINWKREIEIFDKNVSIVDGNRWVDNKFTIVNFDILKNFHTIEDKKIEFQILKRTILDTKFDAIIIDEAHYLKDSNTIRGGIVNDLIKLNDFKRIWLLTGTPVANRPIDFFNLLKMIKSPLGDNWMFFSKRYCDAKKMYRTMKNGKKKQLWINSGASNLDELHNKTKNIMLRRLKSEVLDMPEKLIIPQYHELSPTQWIEYDGLWEDYLVERKKKGKRGNLDKDLLELILLRKFVAMEMIPNTIELVDDLILEDKKVIIFTTFTEELNELKNHFGKKCVTHNGPMSTKDKQKSVDEFQNNPNIKVFIGNVISAGVGITLTAANVVVFNSYAWVPGINNQCEDRSHRLGQKSDVLVYYQLFENSVSVRIWETLKSKQSIIDQIMVGNEETITDKIIEMIYEQS